MSDGKIEIGVCTGVENAGALAGAGVEFIEVNVQGFLKPEAALRRAQDGLVVSLSNGEADDADFVANRDRAASSPLPLRAANCFLPGKIKTTGPEVDVDGVVRYAETAFARAAEAGIGFIVYGSGGSRSLPEGWAKDKGVGQLVEALKAIAPAAQEHGVTIVMEPLNSKECNFINSLAEAAELVEGADHPNVKLLADLYHMARDGEAPSQIERFGAMLRHVHIAEVEKRTAPGVEGDDFRPYLKALKAAGYSGGISMECRWDDLASDMPKAVEYLRAQMADVGL